MGLVIRRMKSEDVPAVSRLVTDCYSFLADRQGFSALQLRRLLEERCSESCVREFYDRFEHYIAACGERIVGVVGIEKNDVAELWVSPDRHRQGIGRALFGKAEELIREAGHTVLTVRTSPRATPTSSPVQPTTQTMKDCTPRSCVVPLTITLSVASLVALLEWCRVVRLVSCASRLILVLPPEAAELRHPKARVEGRPDNQCRSQRPAGVHQTVGFLAAQRLTYELIGHTDTYRHPL